MEACTALDEALLKRLKAASSLGARLRARAEAIALAERAATESVALRDKRSESGEIFNGGFAPDPKTLEVADKTVGLDGLTPLLVPGGSDAVEALKDEANLIDIAVTGGAAWVSAMLPEALSEGGGYQEPFRQHYMRIPY